MKMVRGLFLVASVVALFHANEAHARVFSQPTRLGLSIGTLQNSSAALSIDSGPVVSDNVTLGGELFGLTIFSLRGLIWEKPGSVSGFYGGPKVIFDFNTNFTAELGVEVGWMHRFESKVDLGLGADLLIGRVIGGTLKVSFGYLL
ncbi:hypothetical protein EBU99_07510 [bacterium]|nr:hypothetical protein [bacterium]